ncbi:MAG: hypothetical protein AB7I36_19020 [Rhodospirillaceae bacterium]
MMPSSWTATVPGPWNLLLYWMSDTGEGSWDRFRIIVSELARSNQDLSQLRRSLRVRLSDFGHANFFVGESSRWQTLPPRVAGLLGINAALLVGARTPNLLGAIVTAADRHGVGIETEASDGLPDLIRLTGSSDALKACAVAAGVDYADHYARRLAALLDPVPLLLERRRRDTDRAPINWVARSFDLQTREWVDGVAPNSACEFTPRYGRPRYFVSNRRRRLLEIAGRRDAVYAAAYMRDVPLATYDAATLSFSVPLAAPLPEAYARTACLCSGRPAQVQQGRLVYSGVPPEIGAVLSTALGQPRAVLPFLYRTQER